MARVKNSRQTWNLLAAKALDGDIVITDPCYFRTGKDWDELEDWIAERGLVSRTFYGDWGCTVYKVDPKSYPGQLHPDVANYPEMGEFCADAGMVCVLKKEDVLNLRPDFFSWWEEHRWCATVIYGFQGSVGLFARKQRRWFFASFKNKREYYTDTELHVRGDGFINHAPAAFESIQTSL